MQVLDFIKIISIGHEHVPKLRSETSERVKRSIKTFRVRNVFVRTFQKCSGFRGHKNRKIRNDQSEQKKHVPVPMAIRNGLMTSVVEIQ